MNVAKVQAFVGHAAITSHDEIRACPMLKPTREAAQRLMRINDAVR
jgi:hypothetical protein